MISKTKKNESGLITDGETVRISGRIFFAGRVMRAPLSKRPCVYYHVIVKDSSSGKEVFRNYMDLEEEKVTDIVLFDGKNYYVVDTKLIAAYATPDESQTSDFWTATTPELKAFLAKHGERTSDYIGWSLDLYAKEGILEEGETVSVAGRASWKKASDFKLKIPATKVVYIESLNEHGVYISDDLYV